MHTNLLVVLGSSRSGHHAVGNWILHLLGDNLPSVPNCIPHRDGPVVTPPLKEPATWWGWFFEDQTLDTVQAVAQKTPTPGDTKVVLVVRAFPNWLASSLAWKLYPRCDSYMRFLAKLWVNNAKSALALPEGPRVLFERWVQHEEYRKTCAKGLGIEYKPGGVDTPATFGPSSYQDMEVLTRGQKMKDNPRFQKHLSENSEAIELTEKLFGEQPWSL